MSSIRRENRLLADIVEANGGVVTNKDNRAKLLNDWLDSLIGTLCNAYLFSSANSDYFEIEPFSGNFKMMVAAESEDGINADIVSGRVGEFIATTDYQDPQWVEYDMNTGYNWTLNGNAYATFSPVEVTPSSEIEIEFMYAGGYGGNSRFLASANLAFNLSVDGAGLKYSLSGCTAKLDGVSVTSNDYLPTDSEPHTLTITPTVTATINTLGDISDSSLVRRIKATITRFSGSNVSSSVSYTAGAFNFELSGAYSESHTAIDNINGVVMNKFNDIAEDYAPLSMTNIVDATFNGVIAKYAKDNVWYSIDMGAEVFSPTASFATYDFSNLTETLGDVTAHADSSGNSRDIASMLAVNDGMTLNGIRALTVTDSSYINLHSDTHAVLESNHTIIIVMALDSMTTFSEIFKATGSAGDISIVVDPLNDSITFNSGSESLTIDTSLDHDVHIYAIENNSGVLTGYYDDQSITGSVDSVGTISSVTVCDSVNGLLGEVRVYDSALSTEDKQELGVGA